MTGRARSLSNFGGNLCFAAQEVYEPENEQEQLDLLVKHPGRKIRSIRRLDSWSEAPTGNDIPIDLRKLNSVAIDRRGEDIWATVGAGCQIKRLLSELDQLAGVTLPSLGLITEQSIAGAIATGTHGSGKNSLSHYVAEVPFMPQPKSSQAAASTVHAELKNRSCRSHDESSPPSS